MSLDYSSSTVVCLAKTAFENFPSQWKIKDRLNGCFKLFRSVLPFNSPLDLEHFFTTSHFENRCFLKTFYGTIAYYNVSNVLQQISLQKNLSLARLCLLSLTKHPPPGFNIKSLLCLPENIIREFLILNFSIYWMPMTHALYHQQDSPSSYGDYEVVFAFMSDLSVFERMCDACRDTYIFTFSWMQHAQFFDSNGTSDEYSDLPNVLVKNLNHSPLVEPHQISNGLSVNLGELLKRASRLKTNTTAEVTAAALLGLKIANFLCECSEYLYAFQAAKAVHETVQVFFALSGYHHIQLRLGYEAMCIMLRSMNCYSMYLPSENRQIFQKDAPNLLKSIKNANLLLTNPDRKHFPTSLILPPGLELAHETITETQSVSHTKPQEHSSSPLSSCSSLSTITGSGDAPHISNSRSSCSTSFVFSESYFPTSRSTSSVVLNLLSDSDQPILSGAFLYAQLANYYYAMCSYQIAYQFTLLAAEQLELSYNNGSTSTPQVIVEVLRIICKMCMIKRKYDLGLRVIRRALSITRSSIGDQNLTYATLLIEYGCLMLNTDKTRKAAKIYRIGLGLILNCLPGASIMVASALEAIAYAHYVLEYTSGEFAYALDCAHVAGLMLRCLNYESCLQAVSANRVKALIIEEIAIDDVDPYRASSYLNLARDLHLESLVLCERTFGLWNIQTAKHFGNLGRLYQSMQANTEAELMHLKAIMIKERLLGPMDFEVGLSVGHLASLYNYDMNRYREAEQLYLRSVQISLNLFGPTYSGLEYDYRGLQRVHQQLGNHAEKQRYQNLFDSWCKERQKLRASEPSESDGQDEPSDGVHLSAQDQWCLLRSCFSDYESVFSSIFQGLNANSDSEEATNSTRNGTFNSCSSGSGGSTIEASRSTGY